MSAGWKSQIRNAFRRFGVDIKRVQPFCDEYENLVFVAEAVGSNIVLDVGANTGAFALEMFRAGFAGHIISFEPLPDAHRILRERSSLNSCWTIAPPMAIGLQEGPASFNVAGNSSSSSLLEMEHLHVQMAPHSRVVSNIEVSVARLDSVAPQFAGQQENIFLKIDTQGSEMDVLRGATGILDRIAVIRTELSFVSLYSRQRLFDEMYPYIRGLGFDLWEITPVLRNPATGQMLQCDATFVRRS